MPKSKHRPLLKDGTVLGTRKILKFVCYLGKYQHYQIECLDCGTIKTMNRIQLEKLETCKVCFRRAQKTQSIKKMGVKWLE